MIKYVSIDGYKYRIVTNCDDIEQYLDKFNSVLNKLTISFKQTEEKGGHVGTLYFLNGNQYRMVRVPWTKSLFVCCPWKQVNESTFFAMLFRCIVELIRQEKVKLKCMLQL